MNCKVSLSLEIEKVKSSAGCQIRYLNGIIGISSLECVLHLRTLSVQLAGSLGRSCCLSEIVSMTISQLIPPKEFMRQSKSNLQTDKLLIRLKSTFVAHLRLGSNATQSSTSSPTLPLSIQTLE